MSDPKSEATTTTEEVALPVPSRWKENVKVLVACLLFGVLGFSAGSFFGPERVEYQEKIVEKWEEKSHERKNLVRTVYVKTTVTPDAGTVTETSIREEDKGEKSTVAVGEALRETVKKTEKRPDWRIGVMAGATWKEPALKLGDTPLVIGATVERRIVGGVSAGAWGTTQGAGGVLLSIEF